MNRRNDQGLGLLLKYSMLFLFCTELFYKKRKTGVIGFLPGYAD